jgi:hypothetical protein
MITGGCQCGAVRFAVRELGRASLCHCRMCQKAFGSFFGPFVSAKAGFRWTRGAPKYFQSSDQVRRGFCGDCGTPLTFEPAGHPVELAIGAFDDPAAIPPTIQLALETRMPWMETLNDLPTRTPKETAQAAAWYAAIRSHQHPDHDTPGDSGDWPRRS